MNSEQILQTDALDILFQNRNKAYGAYTLRKFYTNRLTRSLLIMTGLVALLSAFTFIPDKEEAKVIDVYDSGFTTVVMESKKPEVKPTVNKKIPPKKVMATLKYVTTISIVNDKDSVEVLHDLTNMSIGSTTNITKEPGIEIIGAGPAGDGDAGIAPPATPAAPDVDRPLETADVMPAFPGGKEALRKFLMRNLSNPENLEEGELVSVKVKFVVGYDGKLKSFELVEDGGAAFNNEVIRVLKKMPAWIPGKSAGRNVSVYYTIPVKFIPEG